MGDLQHGLEAAGYKEGEANETVEKEKQRILLLLSNPATKFRINQDYYYQDDERLKPMSAEYKPFGEVLMEDWEQYIATGKNNQVSKESLEQEWLSPIVRDEIEKSLQDWVDATKDEKAKNHLINYKQTFLTNLDNYESQQKASQELLKAPVAINSRLYRDFAGDYTENKNGVQNRYANVSNYLSDVLKEIQSGSLPLPKGCKSPADVLNPFWQTESLETKNHNQVFLGSRLGLEYGARFYDNPESRLLLHVAENLPAKKKSGFSGTELESVSLDKIYDSLSDYIRQAAERLEAGDSNLPEGAENLAEAISPLSREDVERWFEEQGIDKKHPLRKFMATGTLTPEQMPLDTEVEVGSDEDMAHHQERWQRQASRPVSYRQPPDFGAVTVSESVAKDFGYKEGDVGREGRAFRAEAAANLRDFKFEPLRQDGVLRMSCIADVNEQGTLRPKKIDIYVNLPKEAIAVYLEGPPEGDPAVQQVLADLLKANDSSKHPVLRYNTQADCLEIGLGGEEHLNVIVSMSTKEMRQAVPGMAGEVNEYVVRKQAARLTPDERQKMWKFENELLKSWQENSSGQEVELRQKIWDEAFLKLFRQTVGEKRFAELGALPGQPVSEPSPKRQESGPPLQKTVRQANILGNKNRFAQVREFMDTPEFQQQAVKFVEAIKKEFGGWEEFLNFAGNVLAIAQSKNVGLQSAPAYIILGREVLGAPERAEQLKKYETLSRLSVGEILGRKLFNLPEGTKVNRWNILRNMLLKYIQENPLPSDKWEKSGPAVESRRPGDRNIQQEPLRNLPANAERQPAVKNDHSDVTAKILARVKKRVAARPYNPDSDPEIEAGII